MNANSTIIHARNVVSQLSGTEKGLQFMGEIGMIRPGDAIKNMVSIQKNKLFKRFMLVIEDKSSTILIKRRVNNMPMILIKKSACC